MALLSVVWSWMFKGRSPKFPVFGVILFNVSLFANIRGGQLFQRTRCAEARNSHGFNITVTYRCLINYSGYLASRMMRPAFGELVRIRERDGMTHITLIMSRLIKEFVRFQRRSRRASIPGMSAILHRSEQLLRHWEGKKHSVGTQKYKSFIPGKLILKILNLNLNFKKDSKYWMRIYFIAGRPMFELWWIIPKELEVSVDTIIA